MELKPSNYSFYGLTPNQAVFDELIATLDKKLDVYDQILSKQKYVVGEVHLSSTFHTV
jgi:glutathione S-transferase